MKVHGCDREKAERILNKLGDKKAGTILPLKRANPEPSVSSVSSSLSKEEFKFNARDFLPPSTTEERAEL